jgi:hypothetical protein
MGGNFPGTGLFRPGAGKISGVFGSGAGARYCFRKQVFSILILRVGWYKNAGPLKNKKTGHQEITGKPASTFRYPDSSGPVLYHVTPK